MGALRKPDRDHAAALTPVALARVLAAGLAPLLPPGSALTERELTARIAWRPVPGIATWRTPAAALLAAATGRPAAFWLDAATDALRAIPGLHVERRGSMLDVTLPVTSPGAFAAACAADGRLWHGTADQVTISRPGQDAEETSGAGIAGVPAGGAGGVAGALAGAGGAGLRGGAGGPAQAGGSAGAAGSGDAGGAGGIDRGRIVADALACLIAAAGDVVVRTQAAPAGTIEVVRDGAVRQFGLGPVKLDREGTGGTGSPAVAAWHGAGALPVTEEALGTASVRIALLAREPLSAPARLSVPALLARTDANPAFVIAHAMLTCARTDPAEQHAACARSRPGASPSPGLAPPGLAGPGDRAVRAGPPGDQRPGTGLPVRARERPDSPVAVRVREHGDVRAAIALAAYPFVLEKAGREVRPAVFVRYLAGLARDLAGAGDARVLLAGAAVLGHGLSALGVPAPARL